MCVVGACGSLLLTYLVIYGIIFVGSDIQRCLIAVDIGLGARAPCSQLSFAVRRVFFVYVWFISVCFYLI